MSARASQQTLGRRLWRTTAWAVDTFLHTVEWFISLALSSPIGQRIQESSLYKYLRGLAWNTAHVFIQKVYMHHLDHIDFVGGPVKGLTVIVTGPTSGIGKETAAALARRGAKVILACRNVAKGEELASEIRAEDRSKGFPEPTLEVRQLDLSSLESVRAFCKAWEQEKRDLHILINNAGIYNMGAPRSQTVDGFEAHMGTNHLGHYLLTLCLIPSLKRGAAHKPAFGARIVSVSSSVHMMAVGGIDIADPNMQRHYSSEQAYGRSKGAQILFTRELRRRLGPDTQIQALCVHPGMVLTEIGRGLPQFVQTAERIILGFILLTPMEGARATMYCATDPKAPAEGAATGGYFNANCRPMQPAPHARDDVAARWLWRWSAEQVALPSACDLAED